MKKHKTIAIVPARGGSKGLPGKNIKLLNGKPLIAYSIEAARAVSRIDQIIISTESGEIADVAKTCGVDVPFMRPANLATDESPTIDLILHCLDMIPEATTVVLLQPTSPFRLASDIEHCLDLYHSNPHTSVVTVTESSKHPAWMYSIDKNQVLNKIVDMDATRRQDLPTIYCLNGAVYVASRELLQQKRTFLHDETLGYIMPQKRSLDIDHADDWEYAEFLISRKTPP